METPTLKYRVSLVGHKYRQRIFVLTVYHRKTQTTSGNVSNFTEYSIITLCYSKNVQPFVVQSNDHNEM